MQVSVNAASAGLEANNNVHPAMQSVEQSCNEISLLLNELSATEEVVTKVDDDIENISAVLLVIQSIAEQTNLLALNAAIQTTELSSIAVKNGKTAELEGLVGQFKV
ncbi:methyl-accepting chemotaxis protein [Paraglaciecola mesophila]|uniref:Methyl-accepting chemotaxis protein n=1 Tax=Paraglaciecola mesophila TaxID=197222 RepID=A0ABU9SYT3_9ALTE